MKRFRDYIKEDNMGVINEYEKYLKSLGYQTKVINSNRIAILSDSDRVSVLKSLEKQLKGSVYNPNMPGSSVGGLKTSDGYTVLVKPMNGGGKGAGSAMTDLTESAQCLYCAAAWYGSDFSSDTLKKLGTYIDTTSDIGSIIKKLPVDWQDSCIAIAKVLKKKYSVKKYKFHRGSTWVETLENKFKSLNSTEKEFANLNKWSPADIYMVTNEGLSENFSAANSLIELNALILKHFRNGDIIPVSLKKVNPDNVTLKIVNYSGDKSTYEIRNPYYTAGKKGFFQSKDVFVNFKEGEIQFRGFSQVNFQGEIKGKYAAHGKIGYGAINNIMKKIVGTGIDSADQIAKIYRNSPNDLYPKFYKYYTTIDKAPHITYAEFVKEASAKDLGWHVSKYIGSQMLYNISSSQKPKLDAFIGALIGYAASQSDMSAVFVKVS